MEDLDRLAEIAAQFAARVREDDPDANLRWLHAQLPDRVDREALLFVLAAAVPVEVPWLILTAWTNAAERERHLRPCGTLAAVRRHQKRGETPCELCKAVERERGRRRRENGAAVA